MVKSPAQLNGSRAHAAAASVHQHLFAGAQLPLHKEIQPGGGKDFRQAGGDDQPHALRHRHHLRRRTQHPVGVAAAAEQGAHLLADRQIFDPLADGLYHPRTLQPQHLAGAGRRRVEPGFLRQIGAIDAGGADADSHLAPGGRLIRALNQLQGAVFRYPSTHICRT